MDGIAELKCDCNEVFRWSFEVERPNGCFNLFLVILSNGFLLLLLIPVLG